MKKNRLKQLWREGKAGYGMWCWLGSAAAVEMMVELDLDWILLDGEHGTASYEACQPLLQAFSASPATALMRVPAIDPVAIKRSLDMGAEGLIVPQIRTAEEVADVVEQCRYPPVGTRGIGPWRAGRFELDFSAYYEQANEEIVLIFQIETREATENIEAILAVEGLDAILIGPADLAASFGRFPDTRHPEMLAIHEDILRKAQAAGKPAGIYCLTPEQARSSVEQGFRMVNAGNDMCVLGQGMLEALQRARGEASIDR